MTDEELRRIRDEVVEAIRDDETGREALSVGGWVSVDSAKTLLDEVDRLRAENAALIVGARIDMSLLSNRIKELEAELRVAYQRIACYMGTD